jgi:hypothetical protein
LENVIPEQQVWMMCLHQLMICLIDCLKNLKDDYFQQSLEVLEKLLLILDVPHFLLCLLLPLRALERFSFDETFSIVFDILDNDAMLLRYKLDAFELQVQQLLDLSVVLVLELEFLEEGLVFLVEESVFWEVA